MTIFRLLAPPCGRLRYITTKAGSRIRGSLEDSKRQAWRNRVAHMLNCTCKALASRFQFTINDVGKRRVTQLRLGAYSEVMLGRGLLSCELKIDEST